MMMMSQAKSNFRLLLLPYSRRTTLPITEHLGMTARVYHRLKEPVQIYITAVAVLEKLLVVPGRQQLAALYHHRTLHLNFRQTMFLMRHLSFRRTILPMHQLKELTGRKTRALRAAAGAAVQSAPKMSWRFLIIPYGEKVFDGVSRQDDLEQDHHDAMA